MSFSTHSQGKGILEHVKEARSRAFRVVEEIHGVPLPSLWKTALKASLETLVLFLLFWVFAFSFSLDTEVTHGICLAGAVGWILWQTGKAVLFHWQKLEKVHRLMEEERSEIEHHREEEREELKELYRARGFEGALLEEVIQVLMADDNRLLRVMLEEELGLQLESSFHPLEHGLVSFCAAMLTAALLFFAVVINPVYGVPLTAFLLALGLATVSKSSFAMAAWTTCLVGFITLSAYFTLRIAFPALGS